MNKMTQNLETTKKNKKKKQLKMGFAVPLHTNWYVLAYQLENLISCRTWDLNFNLLRAALNFVQNYKVKLKW